MVSTMMPRHNQLSVADKGVNGVGRQGVRLLDYGSL